MNQGMPVRLESIVREWQHVDLITVALVFLLAWFLAWFVRWCIHFTLKALAPRWRLRIVPWIHVLRLIILFGALATVVPILIQPTRENMLALLGASVLAIGFSFKDLIISLFGGIFTVFEGTYRVGDWVSIGDDYGEVMKVGFRAIMLRTVDDTEIIVPHGKIWSEAIRNATSGKPELMCNISFYINPKHSASMARSILINVAKKHPLLMHEDLTKIAVKEHPWATELIIRAYVNDSRRQFEFMSDLTVIGKDALLTKGIDPPQLIPTAISGSCK